MHLVVWKICSWTVFSAPRWFYPLWEENCLVNVFSVWKICPNSSSGLDSSSECGLAVVVRTCRWGLHSSSGCGLVIRVQTRHCQSASSSRVGHVDAVLTPLQGTDSSSVCRHAVRVRTRHRCHFQFLQNVFRRFPRMRALNCFKVCPSLNFLLWEDLLNFCLWLFEKCEFKGESHDFLCLFEPELNEKSVGCSVKKFCLWKSRLFRQIFKSLFCFATVKSKSLDGWLPANTQFAITIVCCRR